VPGPVLLIKHLMCEGFGLIEHRFLLVECSEAATFCDLGRFQQAGTFYGLGRSQGRNV
jgi:hypothetical protein